MNLDTVNGPSKTKTNPENCKNCSSKSAYNCAQLQYTIQHRTVLIISPLTTILSHTACPCFATVSSFHLVLAFIHKTLNSFQKYYKLYSADLSCYWPCNDVVVCIVVSHAVQTFIQYRNLLLTVPSRRATITDTDTRYRLQL